MEFVCLNFSCQKYYIMHDEFTNEFSFFLQESIRSRVAMDFTGSVGRIVEDPKEAKDIAENEGMVWRRRWRPFSRTPPGCAMMRLHGLDAGIHVLQPWFHGGLKRDVAAAIIRDHGSVDG